MKTYFVKTCLDTRDPLPVRAESAREAAQAFARARNYTDTTVEVFVTNWPDCRPVAEFNVGSDGEIHPALAGK